MEAKVSVVAGIVNVMTVSRDQTAGPAGLVAAVCDSLSELDQVLWAARTPAELLAAKQQIERLRSRLAAVDARLCVEIEASRAAEQEQYASAGDYVTSVTGGYRGLGRRWLRTAADLTGDRGATLTALTEGKISVEQAQVICAALRKLPVKQTLRVVAETELLEVARTLNASELKEAGKLLLDLLDPDGSERREEAALARQERSAHSDRFLSIVEDGLGGVRVRGRGTVEDAAVIKAALLPLTAPNPAGGDPGAGGRPGGQADGGVDHSAPPAAGPAANGCDRFARVTRDYSVRLWDALVESCQRLLDTETQPTDHGRKPRVGVTISLQDLVDLTGRGTLETGGSLSASTMRRLCCDADIYPVVLGANSEILDVGRTVRLVGAAIWSALVIRDQHCAFPGCRRPPIACDAHHIRAWADGGVTSLANTCLLCRAHHTMVHETGWEIRLNANDQRPDFHPPPHLDPHRRPIRDRSPREGPRPGWPRDSKDRDVGDSADEADRG